MYYLKIIFLFFMIIYMFSFKFPENQDAYPVGRIQGGHRDGDLLWLYNPNEVPDTKEAMCKEGFFDNISFSSDDGGEIIPMPCDKQNQRNSIVVVGPSGTGKSTWISGYLKEFFDVFPDGDAVLFTINADMDPAFHELERIKPIIIDESLIVNPIRAQDLATGKPRLCLFDDFRSSFKKIDDEVRKLQNMISEVGRKLLLHQVTATTDIRIREPLYRDLLSNTQTMCWFPARAPSNLRRVLENYFEISDQLRMDIKRWDTRWIIIDRQTTPFIMGSNIAVIYDHDRETQRIKEKKPIKVEKQVFAGKVKKEYKLKLTEADKHFAKREEEENKLQSLHAERELRKLILRELRGIEREHVTLPEQRRRVEFEEIEEENAIKELEKLYESINRLKELRNPKYSRQIKKLEEKVDRIKIRDRDVSEYIKETIPKPSGEDYKNKELYFKRLRQFVATQNRGEGSEENLQAILRAIESIANIGELSKEKLIEKIEKDHRIKDKEAAIERVLNTFDEDYEKMYKKEISNAEFKRDLATSMGTSDTEDEDEDEEESSSELESKVGDVNDYISEYETEETITPENSPPPVKKPPGKVYKPR